VTKFFLRRYEHSGSLLSAICIIFRLHKSVNILKLNKLLTIDYFKGYYELQVYSVRSC
jgi:hypothetical protein